MKRNRYIIYMFIIALLLSAPVVSEEHPAWWKQVADEAQRDGYSLVILADLKNLYESKEPFLIVDTRAEYEYNDGHLPDAVSFEFDLGDKLQLKPKKTSAFLNLLGPDKNRKIIFYCRSFR